jgi:hypothetical protein
VLCAAKALPLIKVDTNTDATKAPKSNKDPFIAFLFLHIDLSCLCVFLTSLQSLKHKQKRNASVIFQIFTD